MSGVVSSQDQKQRERPTSREQSRLGFRDVLVASVIFFVVLALRLALLANTPDASWPHSMLYEGDAPVWATWAQQIVAGEPFEENLPFRTPGVAFLLAWIGASTAPFTAAKALWCAMSAATAAATYLVLARFFTRRAGLIAAMLLALSFAVGVAATSLNNETPYALLLILIVGATLRWCERATITMSVILGGLHALALLLRAEHALFVAFAAVGMIVAARRSPTKPQSQPQAWSHIVRQSAWIIAAGVVVLLPWTLRSHAAVVRYNSECAPIPYDSMWPEWRDDAIAEYESLPAFVRTGNFATLNTFVRRNQLQEVDAAAVKRYFDETWGFTPSALPVWSIVSFKGGLDFALANDPRSDGGFSREPLTDRYDQNPPFSFARPSHAQMVEQGYAIGWQHLTEDPARTRTLIAEKLLRFTDGATLGIFASNWPYNASDELIRQPVDLAVPARWSAPIWSSVVLCAITLGTIVAGFRRGGWLLLLALLYRIIIVAAFYGYARHAASIAPILAALAALGIDAILAGFLRILPFGTACIGRLAFAILAPLVAVALLVIAFGSAIHPPSWTARTATLDGRIELTPALGEGAFTSNDRLRLLPRGD
jgi:MFS family permease